MLLVEDNLINQQVARELLSLWGVQVQIVGNGRQAVEQVQKEAYAAVLMDIEMPEMDGLEAVASIRQLPGTIAAVPVIAMTAHAMAQDRDKGLAAGFNEYITKPLDPDLLLKVLLRWLDPEQKTDPPLSAAAPVAFAELSDLPEVPEKIAGIDVTFGLKRLVGKRKLYGKVLYVFGQDNQATCQQVQQALAGRDFKRLAELVHRVKGTAGVIGATRVCRAAEVLDAQLKQGEEDLAAGVARLCAELQQVLQSIEQIFKDYRNSTGP